MRKNILLVLLFCCQFLFGQGKFSDQIYASLDAFVENPSVEALKKLEADGIKFNNRKSKSKEELLALVILYCNKAYYENQFGYALKAIASYEKGWHIFEINQLDNYDIVDSCIKPLGNLYSIVGDYENAENTIKHYFYIASARQDQDQKIAAILNLSNVYQSSGKNDLALALLEKTLVEEKPTITQKGLLLNNLGTNYMLKDDFDKAWDKLETSIKLLAADKKQQATLSNCYRNLAFIAMKKKKFENATAYFNKAEALFSTQPQEPRKKAKLYYDKALLQFEQGDLAASETTIQTVFKILVPDYSLLKSKLPNQKFLYAETVLLDALDLLAAIFSSQHQFQEALDCYAHSFYIEALFQSLLFYENSRIISQMRNRDRSEKCIAICNRLYSMKNDPRYLENAFQYSEQNKSSVLQAIIASERIASEEERKISEELQQWTTVILKEQQKSERADIAKINDAITKQNELMLLLQSIKKNKTAINESLNLKAIFEKLEKDKAMMVTYFYGLEQVYSFTLKDHTIKLNVLESNAASKKNIQDFLDFFDHSSAITNDVTGYNTTGNELYRYLKLPTRGRYEKIVIVPDGLLNFIPFEALITQQTNTTNFAKMHYFLNDFKVSYSTSVFFYLDAKPFNHKQETVLGVFPLFENTNSELAYSKKEMEHLRNCFEGNYLQGSKATFDHFRLEAGKHSILHLSTHASSGDAYHPASLKFHDGEILYSELYSLNIYPDLVVLSACETGLGKWYKSEGAMSISRGFQLAGAKNLLFSLWRVNDYTTSVLMHHFYLNLKKDNNYSEAIHQAKLDFLNNKNISNAQKSPYYWSAFVYYGTLETKTDTNYLVYILIFLGAIGLFLLFRKIKFSKK